ncbi:AtzE family amidohydrolase [Segnochrobactraceae bacterium EtOH-i3]
MQHINPLQGTATEIIGMIRRSEVTAADMVRLSLAAIEAINPRVNAVTDLTAERAVAEATAIDEAHARGEPLPPLAGVPYGVKNLFDIDGLPTRAGARINAGSPAATADAALIARMKAAGALLVGALAMDEYATGFTGTNVHGDVCRNPHDLARMAGGSSSGPAAAVAAGLMPVALGSDTNGSIRVPASFCGLFGLKPTFGRMSRAGAFPCAASLDHVGPLARSAEDLALLHDVLAGHDPADPASARRTVQPVLPDLGKGAAGLRLAIAGDWFRNNAGPEAVAAVEMVARVLGITREVSLPEVARARAAADLISSSERAALHLERLQTRAAEFAPETRERMLAGALLPAAWVNRAQRFRAWFRQAVQELFETVDVLIAPATPFSAPALGQTTVTVNGREMPVRPAIGLHTQPLSFIGLPVVAVPLWPDGADMPIAVQVIAAPWREDLALRVAHELERCGAARAPIALIPG